MNDFDYDLLERYLNLFGFDLDQNPSLKELKLAYRKLMAKNHPDKVNKLDKEIQDVAEKRTQELNEAFDYIEKNYTPKAISERLQKINEENFDLKQKLNDLEIQLDKIKNPQKYKKPKKDNHQDVIILLILIFIILLIGLLFKYFVR